VEHDLKTRATNAGANKVSALLLVCLWLATGTALAADRPAAIQGRPDNRTRFCGFGGNREVIEWLSGMWPNLEYCRAFDPKNVEAMAQLRREAKQLGVRYSLQSSAPVFPDGYLDKHDCWAIDFLNRKPAQVGMGHPVADYCHPATMAALKDNLKVAMIDAKASSFMMVDFVWPWVGGPWGYSKECVAAYRAALNGTDGGLSIDDGAGRKELSFADYLFELSGVRFTPQDLGYQKWDEYQPPRPNEEGNRSTDARSHDTFLFRGLYHYCWLRYAQEAGVYAHSLGGELQASLNPENLGNGTDLLMWGRLAATGEPWMEEWGSPGTAIAGYHTFRYFMQPYRARKRRVGLIAETGAAGGHPTDSGFGPARPHYWDPNSNYAVTWMLSAAGRFDDREEDYIYASPKETMDPLGPLADCWRGYVKGMDGFWQYALDAPRRPVAPVLSIVNRSILHNTDNSEGSTWQRYNLAPPLEDLHIDFEQGYFPLSDSMLADRKILLFSPWDYPANVLPRLAHWLSEDTTRVLVTHSFVPTRPCKGVNVDVVLDLDDVKAAEELGLRGLSQTSVQSGKISEIDPAWAGDFELPVGTQISLTRPLVACEGKALVKLDGAALVTQVEDPERGKVIYLNFTPPERYETAGGSTDKLLLAVLNAVMRHAAIKPLADGAPAWSCARFDLADGQAYFLLDRAQLKQTRFTEETPSYDPAAKLALQVEPGTSYWIYDLLAETVGTRRSDDAGRLEIFLAGRSVRLLYLLKSGDAPRLLFSTCERRDGTPRNSLPAKLFAHRAGSAVITDIPAGTRVMMDGQPAPTRESTSADSAVVLVPQGSHTITVRKEKTE
jgi:hypothetical protein